MFGGRWWVAEAWEIGPLHLVSWVVWVIASIVLHELAHGWVAIANGDRTPIETGHMTWNPLVHMGQMSLLVFAIAGVAWGAMPVNRSRFRHRYSDALVSFAGPAMNLLLFAICVLAAAGVLINVTRLGDPLGPNLFEFFVLGAYLNLALMVLNLLPVPPFDGSRIVANIYPPYAQLWSGERAQLAVIVIFGVVLVFGGRVIFGIADDVTVRALDAVLGAAGYQRS